MARSEKNFETIYNDVLIIHGKIRLRLPNEHMTQIPNGFGDLLHANIQSASINHYLNGDYRNAVLDGLVALFDLIRERTGLNLDGDDLCNQAFSPNKPLLILSELDSNSGKND